MSSHWLLNEFRMSSEQIPANFKLSCYGALLRYFFRVGVAYLNKELPSDAFIETLRKLIAESKYLQNNPRLKITPEEKLGTNQGIV